MKGKVTAGLPSKRLGLSIRGALGELNSNVQAQRENIIGKVAVAAAEYEKKATLSRNTSRRHVTLFYILPHTLMHIFIYFTATASFLC